MSTAAVMISSSPSSPGSISRSEPASTRSSDDELDDTSLSLTDVSKRVTPDLAEEKPLNATTPECRLKRLEKASLEIIDALGEDPTREARMARALQFFTSGYTTSLQSVVNDAIFEADCDEMVMVKDIEIYSLCEHHMIPFWGVCHIGYLPKKKVLGLSKLARIAEVFARRLQIQERLTREIAQAIMEVLDPAGVAVVVECQHMCMSMRGAQKSSASTVTSAMLGTFRTDSRTRDEFLRFIGRHG